MHRHKDSAAQFSWLGGLWLLNLPSHNPSPIILGHLFVYPLTKLHALSWLLPWRVTLPPVSLASPS